MHQRIINRLRGILEFAHYECKQRLLGFWQMRQTQNATPSYFNKVSGGTWETPSGAAASETWHLSSHLRLRANNREVGCLPLLTSLLLTANSYGVSGLNPESMATWENGDLQNYGKVIIRLLAIPWSRQTHRKDPSTSVQAVGWRSIHPPRLARRWAWSPQRLGWSSAESFSVASLTLSLWPHTPTGAGPVARLLWQLLTVLQYTPVVLSFLLRLCDYTKSWESDTDPRGVRTDCMLWPHAGQDLNRRPTLLCSVHSLNSLNFGSSPGRWEEHMETPSLSHPGVFPQPSAPPCCEWSLTPGGRPSDLYQKVEKTLLYFYT